jgi:hypothetical protein
VETTLTCTKCDLVRTPQEQTASPACPRCGSYDTSITTQDHATALEQQVDIEKSYFQKNWPVLLVIVALTLGSPFLGLIVSGWPGVATGEALGIITTIVGFYAGTLVHERDRHHFH